MGSFHDDMAGPAVARMVEHFGERDEAGEFQHAIITLPSLNIILWPCSVGELTTRLVEENGNVVQREACELIGLTEELPTRSSPLPEGATVLVLKYGDVPFSPDPELSRYGGPTTKLALLRAPFVRVGNLHETAP